MTAKCVFGAQILECELPELGKQYATLLGRLYGPRADAVGEEELRSIIIGEDELLVFMVEEDCLVGIVQGSLSRTDPDWNVLIGNVIVRPDHDGRGFGRRMMEQLETRAKEFWGSRVRFLVLSNAPQKRNGGFYQKIGFHPRIDDRWPVVWLKKFLDWIGYTTTNETVVWVKQI